jgi:excisionase family DNA binding protein
MSGTVSASLLPRSALSVKEFCASVGIGRTLFYKLVNAGEISVVKLGGRTLVPYSEITRSFESGSGD